MDKDQDKPYFHFKQMLANFALPRHDEPGPKIMGLSDPRFKYEQFKKIEARIEELFMV